MILALKTTEIPGDFAEADKLILKFIREYKGTRTAKPIWKMDNKLGKLKCPSLKTYYKTTQRYPRHCSISIRVDI